jgi:hypothetical protein
MKDKVDKLRAICPRGPAEDKLISLKTTLEEVRLSVVESKQMFNKLCTNDSDEEIAITSANFPLRPRQTPVAKKRTRSPSNPKSEHMP